jgi:hypothetical protein
VLANRLPTEALFLNKPSRNFDHFVYFFAICNCRSYRSAEVSINIVGNLVEAFDCEDPRARNSAAIKSSNVTQAQAGLHPKLSQMVIFTWHVNTMI